MKEFKQWLADTAGIATPSLCNYLPGGLDHFDPALELLVQAMWNLNLAYKNNYRSPFIEDETNGRGVRKNITAFVPCKSLNGMGSWQTCYLDEHDNDPKKALEAALIYVWENTK